MVHIRKAGIDDYPTVIEWIEKLLRELENPDQQEFGGLDKPRILKEMLENRGRFYAFLAWSDPGEIVGVITVVESFAIYAGGSYGVIDEMYVAPTFRSSGVGKSLIAAVVNLAREQQWLRIDVTAPPEEAWVRSVRFYQKNGFVFTGPKLRFKL